MSHLASPQSEKLLLALFESAPDAIVVVNSAGIIVRANRQVETLFGYVREELAGQAIEILLPEHHRDAHVAHRIRYGKQPRVRSMGAGLDLHGQRRDGSVFPVEISLSPIKSGEELLVAAAIRDTSELNRVKAAAARAQQQGVVARLGMRAISNPDLDALMQEAVGSIAACLQVDYCKILELLPAGDALLLRAGVGWKEGLVGRATVQSSTHSQAGYTLDMNSPVVVEDLAGETRFRGPPLLLQHGVVSGISVVIHGLQRPFGVLGAHTKERRIFTREDVNFLQATANVIAAAIERKKAEETVRRHAEMLDLSQEPILAWQSGKGIVYWNEGAARVYGYSKEEAVGRNSHELLATLHSSGLQQIEAIIKQTGEWSGALVHRTREGRRITVESRMVLARSSEGQELVIQTNRDITARLEAEAALRQAQKMEAVGQLTGGIAHDFNNLLSVISINLQMLRDRVEGNAQLLKLTETAARATWRGAELIQKLLAFSRLQPLQPRQVNVEQLVSAMKEMLSRTLGETIQIKTVLEPDILLVFADPGQLENALLNLALNARDAMPEGGKLTIETSAIRAAEPSATAAADLKSGCYVVLAVSDTGTGMPPEIIERAFEPFFTTKKTGKGSGMGLAMVYGFAKQSGGDVRIYSAPGQGTTVKLYLPIVKEPAQPATPERQSRHTRLGQETVLLAEDDEAVRHSAAALLSDLGYRVIEAADGRAALERLKKFPEIALLFSDVVMPGGLSGPELAIEAKRLRPDLKILFTSGYAEQALLRHEKLELISKPYSKDALARKIRAVLDAHTPEPS